MDAKWFRSRDSRRDGKRIGSSVGRALFDVVEDAGSNPAPIWANWGSSMVEHDKQETQVRILPGPFDMDRRRGQ